MPAGRSEVWPGSGLKGKGEAALYPNKRQKGENGLLNHGAISDSGRRGARRGAGREGQTNDGSFIPECSMDVSSEEPQHGLQLQHASTPAAQRRRDDEEGRDKADAMGRQGISSSLSSSSGLGVSGDNVFDCKRQWCGGKLHVGDHACRFGHGLVVRCTKSTKPAPSNRDIVRDGMALHRYKWCNKLYDFIPAEEWQHHLAWCSANAPEPPAAICTTKSNTSHVASSEATSPSHNRTLVENKSGNGATDGSMQGEGVISSPTEHVAEGHKVKPEEDDHGSNGSFHGQRNENGGNGPDTGQLAAAVDSCSNAENCADGAGLSRPSGSDCMNGTDEKSAASEIREHGHEEAHVPGGGPDTGSNFALGRDMSALLRRHAEVILNGESACTKQWSKQLSDHRGRTLVSELYARANLNSSGEGAGESAHAFFLSVMRGDLEAVSNLIAEGIDVNVQDAGNNTPLHWAASAGSTDVGRLLLDSGADLCRRGVRGNLAVHMAAAQGRMGFLQMCVARGANLDVLNEDGVSARHLLNLLVQHFS